MADPKPAESYLPVPPLWFGAMLAMSDEPKHGYGIVKEIESRSVTGKRPAAGTIYIALQRLMAEGLIEERAPRKKAAKDGRGKRLYGLTRLGRRVSALEAHRMTELVAISTEKKLIAP
ncbi:MAG: PadR family transcriptional regulator [Longimicrobiales bacterium]